MTLRRLPNEGSMAARRYSQIAPAVAHAQHMPSHIFTRVGAWKESVASNLAAVRVGRSDTHAMDYLVYAYLQLAEDRKAKEVIEPDYCGGGNFNAYALPHRRRATCWNAMIGWGQRRCRYIQAESPVAQAVTHFCACPGRSPDR